MKTYLETFLPEISEEFLEKHTQALMHKELPQTVPANHAAADYIYDLLKRHGFDAERSNFIADGKTVYQDHVMPLCWDMSYGKLTVLSDWEGERVIADYEKEPFSLIRFSVATPEGGITTRLVKWDDMAAGKDVRGALVLLPSGMFPTEEALVPILDAGAIGLVNGTVQTHRDALDSVHWANNCTETKAWYVTAGERDFIGFCITPRTRQKLEAACDKGEVIVKAETDARRYEGTLPCVTALLPGKSKREFWVIAHSSEPLECDNSSGVISAIHSLIAIKKALDEGKIPPLYYSLRVLFSPERYGPVAFAHRCGDVLRDRCIGALCIDGGPLNPDYDTAKVLFAPPAIPFYGNAVLQGMCDEITRLVKASPFITTVADYWGDDCFMSDTTIGLPTVSQMHEGPALAWHNSTLRYGSIDYAKFRRITAMHTAFIAAVTVCDGEKMTRFLSAAAAYAIQRLARAASTPPPRPGTDARERLDYLKNIELANIRSFADARASREAIENACGMIEDFAVRLTPVPAEEKREATPAFDAMAEIIPSQNCIGIPHDLARLPLDVRRHMNQRADSAVTNFAGVVKVFLLSRVFSAMDGKKTLQRLVTEAEWDENSPWTDAELAAFRKTLDQLAQYGYIVLRSVP